MLILSSSQQLAVRYKPVHAWTGFLCLKKNSRSRFVRLFFPVRFAAKRYILQQKCLLGTRWYNF